MMPLPGKFVDQGLAEYTEVKPSTRSGQCSEPANFWPFSAISVGIKEILEIAEGTKQLAVVVLPWQTRTRYLFFRLETAHSILILRASRQSAHSSSSLFTASFQQSWMTLGCGRANSVG
jgi:hypothetical protein